MAGGSGLGGYGAGRGYGAGLGVEDGAGAEASAAAAAGGSRRTRPRIGSHGAGLDPVKEDREPQALLLSRWRMAVGAYGLGWAYWCGTEGYGAGLEVKMELEQPVARCSRWRSRRTRRIWRIRFSRSRWCRSRRIGSRSCCKLQPVEMAVGRD
ncbi:hypothetical protein HNY73_014714 [Argiope bruennichi]|uniref:Uncharacterized protein n=1 Tax=Argiope bruennichi TaxID=94029 RepID=A0A8T0ERP1_ARGBR|nr:hypothetical protein HNY73_014714 [Argiope bruennichi]